MEDTASGSETAMLALMRALARKGACLQRDANGSAIVRTPAGTREVRGDTSQVVALIDRGHVREIGGGTYCLSKKGAARLRAVLNRQAAEAAAKPVRAVATPRAPPRAPTRALINDAESPLAWLRSRRDKSGVAMISQPEFDAGERLRLEFTLAQMMPRVTSAWSSEMPAGRQPRGVPGAGLELSERALAARQRVERALAAVGPELSGILIDVCCFLKGIEQAETAANWPRRSGKVVLQLALARLARHYGLIQPVSPTGSGRIRHWGDADYRPQVDADASGDEDGTET